jgi:DNA-directed RNA polymerase specialized sigma subunit
MIRTDKEYNELMSQMAQTKQLIAEQRKTLAAEGLTGKEIERALAPTVSFSNQFAEELEFYKKLKSGSLPPFDSFESIGQALVALRIAKDLTQRELAQRLNVAEAQVSRDERNEYHGITIERAQRVLDAMGATVKLELKIPA